MMNYVSTSAEFWIKCQKCNKWMHGECAGVGEDQFSFESDIC